MPVARFRCIRHAFMTLFLAVAAGAQQPGKPPAQSSTSATGQFVIHGADLATRGNFCLTCDDIAAALGRLLRDEARYTLPVVVALKSPPDVSLSGPAVSWNISQLAHGGFHLQVNATLRTDFRGDDFARELVRVLLAERILRSHKELKTRRPNVLPNWILTGVTHALEFRGRSRPSLLFAAVFHSGQIYSIDKILSADPGQLDALARGVYETSACALVLALLDQPDGSLRFAKFLDALARDDKSDRELLRQLFPTLGASKNSLEKWWSLQMATLATPSALETLGIDETEAKLRDALTLVFDPLPETKKGKTEGATPVKKSEPQEKSNSRGLKSIFGSPDSRTPISGGKKILFVPVSDADTDGSSASAKKPIADQGIKDSKPAPVKGTAKKTSDNQKSPAKESPNKVETRPAASKDEPAKRNMLDPRNWFREKGKSDEESSKNEAPGKSSAVQGKKTQEPTSDTARLNSTNAKLGPGEKRGSSLPLEDFAAIWNRKDRDKIFQRTINQLNTVKAQAHPLYRPLFREYMAAVQLLIGGKQKSATERLVALSEQHAVILKQARAVESHMDWYEASQTKSYSGVFDDYLKLGDQIDRESRIRNDALSKYLDTLAKEYEK